MGTQQVLGIICARSYIPTMRERELGASLLKWGAHLPWGVTEVPVSMHG